MPRPHAQARPARQPVLSTVKGKERVGPQFQSDRDVKNIQGAAAELAGVPARKLEGTGIGRFRNGVPGDRACLNVVFKRSERSLHFHRTSFRSKQQRLEGVYDLEFAESR
jgi:hypothetical protein